VVFVEQNVRAPVGDRYGRWWAAYTGGSSANLPLVMLDSGHQISNGSKDDFEAAYRPLVDTELLRPPKAEIEAFTRRVGNRIRVYARMRNTSGAVLGGALNKAALHALVWEDKRVGVTSDFVRSAPWMLLSGEVAPGGEATATLQTADLTGVSWQALHTVVLADYVPGPGRAFDMLQAALAEPVGLTVSPETVTVAVDANDPRDLTIPLRLRGPYVLNWTAAADAPWITIAPEGAGVGVQPTLTIAGAHLSNGWQESSVHVWAASEDGMSFAQTLTVRALLAPREVRVGSTTARPGTAVGLPVELSALGDESSVSFSLAWDPGALTPAGLGLLGEITSDMLTVDWDQADAGRLGVRIDLPSGRTFTQGNVQLLQLSFAVSTVAPGGATTVRFADEPASRRVTDTNGSTLTATYFDGTVTIPLASSFPPRRHLGRSGL